MAEKKKNTFKRKVVSILEGRKVKTSASSSLKKPGQIAIDYPQSGEAVLPEHYSIRIGATRDSVELSINGGEWQACRAAGGYYWYDWYTIPPGKHKCVARMKMEDGKYKKSKVTVFNVTRASEKNLQS